MLHKDPTEFRERFQRWKKGEQVYENGLALPAYEDGLTPLRKSEVNVNEATYVPEEGLYKPRYTLPEVTVIGDKKKVGTGMGKRLYMHPWKTVGDLSREQHESEEIAKNSFYGSPELYNVTTKDLRKPLSPVDPVGEFVVATATLNPAFKYMFGGMGSAAAELTGFNSAKRYMSNYIRQHVPLGIYDTRKQLLTGLIRGNYMADGSESDIFTNVAGDKVFKVNTDAVSSTIKGARDFANRYMQQRNSAGQLPITLKGIVRDVTKGRNKSAVYRPVFEQERVTPLPENADFNQVLQTFNKNGDRVIDGNIITANGKVISDLNPYNIGIDKNGNYVIFDGEVSDAVKNAVRNVSGQDINNAINKGFTERFVKDFSEYPQEVSEVLQKQVVPRRLERFKQLQQTDGTSKIQNYINTFGDVDFSTPRGLKIAQENGWTFEEVQDYMQYKDFADQMANAVTGGYRQYPLDAWNLRHPSKGGSVVTGTYNPTTDTIELPEGFSVSDAVHEARHRIQMKAPTIQNEKNILHNAYDYDLRTDEEGLKILKDELETVNSELRERLLDRYNAGNMSPKTQNTLLGDKKWFSDDEILDALENTNAYGARIVKGIRNRIEQIKKSIKNQGLEPGTKTFEDEVDNVKSKIVDGIRYATQAVGISVPFIYYTNNETGHQR